MTDTQTSEQGGEKPVPDPMDGVKIVRSRGRNKDAMPVFFVRPLNACENRSRRFMGYKRRDDGIHRWFGPMVIYYLVDGHLIGSNSPKNALKEYWRICSIEKVKQKFEVKELLNS